jgi:hypothetical protein
MTTVHKFELQFKQDQHILLPVGAEILSVGNQLDRLFMWVKLDTSVWEDFPRIVHVVGTGIPMTHHDVTFIGSVFFAGGTEVYHVFVE